MTKECSRCKKIRPVGDFYWFKTRKEYKSECKSCARKDKREFYYKNRKKINAKLKSNKKGQSESNRHSKKKFPEKSRSRDLIHYALKIGHIKKLPCEECGSKKVHGHHTDYQKPLEVKWLCQKHHCELHVKLREILLNPL